MYKIFLDGLSLYDSFIKDLKIFNPKLSLEQNGLSSFEFTIYPTHPLYNKVFPLKSLVEVYQRDSLIFRGRVFELEASTQNAKKIYCEDELAFLCDSIQAPYNHTGSVQDFFNKIVQSHNEQVEEFKRFKVGTIDSFDKNNVIVRAESDYFNTWETIKKKLFDITGGYLRTRHEKDGVYLDYLEDFTTLNAQEIEFGANMLTVKRTEDNGDIATVLIPLGATKEQANPSQPTSEPQPQPETGTQERLTIAEVNGGKIYIENAENIKKFGRIVKAKTWDDVKDANILKTKGIQALEEMGKQVSTVEITAIDLANIKKDIYNFRMGSKIKVKSVFHGLDDYFVPMKMSISLFKPANNKITLNGKAPTLSGSYASDKAYIANLGESVKNVSTTVESFNLGDFKYKPDSGGLSFVKKGTSNVIYDVHSSGNGMAFGKPSERENLLDFGWDVKYKNDRDWTALTLTDFKAFDANSTPEYRVRDHTVELRGVISPLTAHTGSDTLETFATLPAELAPSKRIDVVCQGDQRATWMLSIQPDGKLQFSKYGKANFISSPTTARCAFHTTYMI